MYVCVYVYIEITRDRVARRGARRRAGGQEPEGAKRATSVNVVMCVYIYIYIYIYTYIHTYIYIYIYIYNNNHYYYYDDDDYYYIRIIIICALLLGYMCIYIYIYIYIVQLLRLRKDLHTGSILRDIVNFHSCHILPLQPIL